MTRTLEPINTYDVQAALRREHFLAQHQYPFLVHALGTLQNLDPAKVDDLTTDRLLLERPRQSLGDSMLVAELAPKDPDQDIVTIGVAPSCDVLLDDASVSKRHAWFECIDEGNGDVWRLWDDDSSAGTQVNSEPLQPRVPRVLTSGDQITLGYVELMFFTSDAFYDLIHGLYASAPSQIVR
jgi:pSer/pThr/pTyr-binding forkhead associated (FHA) protein